MHSVSVDQHESEDCRLVCPVSERSYQKLVVGNVEGQIVR